jgi:hypothetical protein
MPRLTLIATIHRDPQGLVRLVQGLKGLKPHVITLEFSTYGLRYRLKKKRSLNHCLLRGLHEIHGIDGLRLGALKELLRTTGIGGIRALLALPFEYKGASFYSQRWDIPLYCVDVSSFSRQLLAKIDELLSQKNLKKVIAFETAPLEETVTREYKQAETLLFNGSTPPGGILFLGTRWGKRENESWPAGSGGLPRTMRDAISFISAAGSTSSPSRGPSLASLKT